MSLNATPSSSRIRIGIFGRRNAGKSTLINAVTGQDLAVVSEVAGTTTDPVSKAMELLPLGPVVITDTPGIDDVGELGRMRVEKARRELNKTDIAVVAIDGQTGVTVSDMALLAIISDKKIPCIAVVTKADLARPEIPELPFPVVYLSGRTGENVDRLKELLAASVSIEEKYLMKDLVKPGDTVILIIPIDGSAPKGRLILPQQQTIRELLELGCMTVAVRETELSEALSKLPEPPALVVTDSQAFRRVAAEVPEDVRLTSFSILFIRMKGNLKQVAEGAAALENIADGDKILISEGCTHHRQCEDIGTVKLPRWIREYTKKEPVFKWSSGGGFPEDLSEYKLIIHCGGCMLNEKEIKYRLGCAADAGVPMTNYGILIAYMNGILGRSTNFFEMD